MYNLLMFVKKHHRLFSSILIVLTYPLIYIFVYYTGGIKFVYSHTMYIPIILAGAVLGFKYGLLAGLIGGILLGPLMPMVVDPYESQDFFNWFFRLIIFMAVGGLVGYFVDSYRRIIKLNDRLYSHHPTTDLFNLNYLYQLDDDYIEGKILIATVLINNKDKINNLLGTEMYIKAMKSMFLYINDKLPKQNVVIQADSDKFWIMFKLDNLLDDGASILKGLTNQVEVDDIKIYIDYSIGVSECQSFRECKSLIPFRTSDQLADYAKSNNLPFVVYDQDLILKKHEFNLLSLFNNAIANNETYLVYHPVVDAQTQEIIGVEALIRWNNPEFGLIMPDNFIPMIESTQLIHTMTEWVFRKVLQYQKRLKDEGFDKFISVNLSTKNIKNPNFYNRVMEITKEEQGLASKIIFEVTETVLLEEEANSKTTLKRIKDAGFKIAIDDFGKGYSSLSYLNQFKTDFLKIDKSYIDQIIEKESIRQIVDAIIKLAHQFQLKVVAEGVEIKEVYDKCKELGIDYIQGFYITEPMTEDDFIEWYKNQLK